MSGRLFTGARSMSTQPAFMRVPPTAMSGWQAAVAQAATQQIRITGMGDSVMAGANATDYLATSYWGVMSAALWNKYGKGGLFLPAAWYAGQVSGTAPWTMNQTNGTNTYNYGPTVNWAGQNNVMPLATLVTPFACTDIDLIWVDGTTAGRTWKYSVDGGAEQTVTAGGTFAQKRTSITGLSNAIHTITVGRQLNDADILLSGAICYASRTTGVVSSPLATGGFAMWNLNQPTPQGDLALLMQGRILPSTATGFGAPTQPHCLILAQGLNDNGNAAATPIGGCGPTQLYHLYRRYCQAARRGNPNCSIICISYSNPDTDSSDLTSGYFTNPSDWGVYVNVHNRIADEFNGVWINFHAKWGETPVAGGYLTQGAAHPNNVGHADMANALLTLL
jgi:hypothetical protein